MENEQIIKHFYEYFAKSDAESMVSSYHDEIEFSDPAFGKLTGEDAKNMWRMLIERAKGNIEIQYLNVAANDKNGSADWTAKYVFSKTNRPVVNEIHAEFEFAGGKIFRHRDTFDIWKWSRQALGLSGVLLGWTPFMKSKIQKRARESLRVYSKKQ